MEVYKNNIVALVLILIVFQFTSCADKASNYELIHPAHIEHIEGSEFSKLELTQKAIERTGILIGEVSEEMVAHSEPQPRKVVAYGALLYGPHGETWVYTHPEEHTYIRANVKVDFIKEGKVYLTDGPPIGTKVVTQGAAELYGTEYAVGH